ncbi:hypothetical protein [Moraxella lacunata]
MASWDEPKQCLNTKTPQLGRNLLIFLFGFCPSFAKIQRWADMRYD